MVLVRSLHRLARPRYAVPVAIALALALLALGRLELPVLAADDPRPWPGGRLSWFDASGSRAAIAEAATRWNRSGVRVQLSPAPDAQHADVVFVANRARLRSQCGARCLGLSSAIGRPRDGHVTVLLNPAITGAPTALNVWVAMHELGHVLGLRHREGTCSLMNAQAYDKACSFAGYPADRGPLPCGPASGDIAAAARLYGRDGWSRPCR
jgi:hypothetical protein